MKAARQILRTHPLVDGRMELSTVLRTKYGNDLSRVSFDRTISGQVDLPNLREGRVGAFFNVVWTPCASDGSGTVDHAAASQRVR